MGITISRGNHKFWAFVLFAFGLVSPINSYASATENLDLTQHWVGYASIIVFVLAYMLVMSEELVHLRQTLHTQQAIAIAEFRIVLELGCQ